MTTPLSQVRNREVRTAADLEHLWRAMMGEGGFGRRTLWLTFLDTTSRPVPVIVPIEDIPQQAEPEQVEGLAMIIDQLTAEDSGVESAILLLSRPGSGVMTPDDRAWARSLAPLSTWPVYLATTDRVQVFAPDDLLPDRG